MLSDATLNRVSSSFRRGYRDGYNRAPNAGACVPEDQIRPFANFDYSEGYKAGANDRRRSDHYAGILPTVSEVRAAVSIRGISQTPADGAGASLEPSPEATAVQEK